MHKSLHYFLLIILLTMSHSSFSKTKIVNLTIGYKTIDFTGKKSQAIAVNDQIPALTLHFKEGDLQIHWVMQLAR